MCHSQSQGDPTAGVALREAKLSPRGSSLQSPILPWPGKFCAEPSPGQAGWREAVSGCAECPQSFPWGCRVSPELPLGVQSVPRAAPGVPKAAPGCPQSCSWMSPELPALPGEDGTLQTLQPSMHSPTSPSLPTSGQLRATQVGKKKNEKINKLNKIKCFKPSTPNKKGHDFLIEKINK